MAADVERVLVAGASGGTGRQLLRELRHTDCTVRALTLSPGKQRDLLGRGADEVVVGDLFEPADAARAVRGCDAVLCAVGSRPGLDLLLRGPVDGDGVRNLVTAAVAADVDLFVYESAIGVGDSREKMPLPFRLALFPVLNAKNGSEAALRTAGLEYVVVRPGGLKNGVATGEVVVGEGGATVSGTVRRADVAWLMVAALYTPAAHNRTFEVVSRRGLRGTPRGVVDVDWRWPMPGEREPVEADAEAATLDAERDVAGE